MHENEVGVDDLPVTKRYFSGGFVECSGKHRIDENLNRVSLTDRRTSCYDIACAMHTRRAVKIAILRTLAFIFVSLETPCDYDVMCCMDGKTIGCLPNPSQRVPISIVSELYDV